MKGVSAVIAIILILMIVVALAALAYTWFTGIFASLTQTAGTAVTSTTGAMATQFRLESAVCDNDPCNTGDTITIVVRNTGTEDFSVAGTTMYVDGINYGLTDVSCTDPIDQGDICQYTATTTVNHACDTSVVSVTIETGLRDSKILEC
jgi:FlaG/FlaF family flagellin (archaellin)